MVPTHHHSEEEEGSDTDSVEEVHITRFLNKGLLQGLQQAKACTDVKIGIRRQPGHYHLRDRTHAVMKPKATAYDGKHWDVPASNRFQRATRRLSAYAIQKAVAREQLQRAKSSAADKQTTVRLFHPINSEFWDKMEQGDEEERKLLAKKHNEAATVKDDVMCQLVSKHNKDIIDEEFEVERERQVAMVSILNGMKDSVHKSRSLEEIMVGIADTNHRKSIVQQDMLEAFARYDDEEQETESEYKSAMLEMMDESLNSLQQIFQREKTKRMEKEEQIRRLEEWDELVLDPKFIKARRQFDVVLGDLQNTFNMVQAQEISESSKLEQDMSDRKEQVLQELRRLYAQRWAERMSAVERKRRMKEEESLLYFDDPKREAMLRLTARVQRQMILQKFGGTWINLAGVVRKDNEISEYDDHENDHDKKLRSIRMKQRRQSCVTQSTDE